LRSPPRAHRAAPELQGAVTDARRRCRARSAARTRREVRLMREGGPSARKTGLN